jgi:hypothetical protein
MRVVMFVLTLIASMAVTNLFFSFWQYIVTMLAVILYGLPVTGLTVIGFKLWKRTRR